MATRSTFEFCVRDNKGNPVLGSNGKEQLITPESHYKRSDGTINAKQYLIDKRQAYETWQARIKANASTKGQETRSTTLESVVAEGSIKKCIDPILRDAKEANYQYITASDVLSIASGGLPVITLKDKERAETPETVKAAIVHYLGKTLKLSAKKGRAGGYSLDGFPPSTSSTTPQTSNTTSETDEDDAEFPNYEANTDNG